MTEYEEHKALLANKIARVDHYNAASVVEGIEVMIDLRVAELLEEVNRRLEIVKRRSEA